MPEPLHEGDQAIIMTGPFESRAGTIIAIDGDVATVTLDVFARKTPVQIRVADLAAPPRTN